MACLASASPRAKTGETNHMPNAITEPNSGAQVFAHPASKMIIVKTAAAAGSRVVMAMSPATYVLSSLRKPDIAIPIRTATPRMPTHKLRLQRHVSDSERATEDDALSAETRNAQAPNAKTTRPTMKAGLT